MNEQSDQLVPNINRYEHLSKQHEGSDVWVLVDFDHPRVIEGYLWKADVVCEFVWVSERGRDSSSMRAFPRPVVFLSEVDAAIRGIEWLNRLRDPCASAQVEVARLQQIIFKAGEALGEAARRRAEEKAAES